MGHAAAVSPALSIPLRAIHLGAGAIWLGGVVALVLALRAGAETALPLVRAVSAAALWSFLAVAVTGAAQALVLLGGPAAIFGTTYGRVVLVKATGLLALAAFGFHHRRLITRMEAGRNGVALRASAMRELLLFIGLIVVSAALSFLPLPE